VVSIFFTCLDNSVSNDSGKLSKVHVHMCGYGLVLKSQLSKTLPLVGVYMYTHVQDRRINIANAVYFRYAILSL
jgi:hypothetical protein